LDIKNTGKKEKFLQKRIDLAISLKTKIMPLKPLT